jgi:hypothetical protein
VSYPVGMLESTRHALLTERIDRFQRQLVESRISDVNGTDIHTIIGVEIEPARQPIKLLIAFIEGFRRVTLAPAQLAVHVPIVPFTHIGKHLAQIIQCNQGRLTIDWSRIMVGIAAERLMIILGVLRISWRADKITENRSEHRERQSLQTIRTPAVSTSSSRPKSDEAICPRVPSVDVRSDSTGSPGEC